MKKSTSKGLKRLQSEKSQKTLAVKTKTTPSPETKAKIKRHEKPLPETMSPSIGSIGNVSTESVFKATKRSWDEWVSLLDRSGARLLTHQEIVAVLRRKYKLNLWWQQIVTSKYEIFIGRRVEGQNQKGKYSMTATKTLPVSATSFWSWICSPEGMQVWLQPLTSFEIKAGDTFEVEGEMYGEVRTVRPKQRFRLAWNCLDWSAKTTLQVSVLPRGPQRCMLVIQHDGLDSAKIKEQMREFWKVRIDAVVDSF